MDYLDFIASKQIRAVDAGFDISMSAINQKAFEWQKYASPVWTDINPSDTLQHKSCRDEKDEKHICPLQLSVIRRAIDLWSNPGETVLTPFMGIGSEAYVALERERKAIGIELKSSWFEQAVRNCKEIVNRSTQITFD